MIAGRLCAICVKRPADRVDAELGASICAECDEGEIRHVQSERRCETSEGIGFVFAQNVAEAYRRTVPARLLKLDEDVDLGIPQDCSPQRGKAFWDDSLTENQTRYQTRARNRSKRKNSL